MAAVRQSVLLSAIAFSAVAAPVQASPAVDLLIASSRKALLSDDLKAHDLAVAAQRAAGQISPGRGRQVAMATTLWLQAEADSRLGNTARATLELDRARIAIGHTSGETSLRADILLTQGYIGQQTCDVAAALSNFQHAYRLYMSIGDQKKAAWSLMGLGVLYSDAKDYLSALKYLDQATATYRSDRKMLFTIYNNRASLLQDLGRYPEAENDNRRALTIAYELRSDLLRVRVITNMARVELKAGQVAAAQAHVATAMTLSAAGEAASWRPQVLVEAARAAFASRDLLRAKMLIEQRFVGIDPATTTQSFNEAHQTAYDIYRALGDDQAALVHLAALKRLDDQATRVATQASAALATAHFDFANQKLKIASLQRDEATRNAAFERARAKTQRQIFIGSSIGLSLLIGLLVFALVTSRRARRQVEAANGDLAVTNAALGKALAAKTEFLAVTSHEIRTPLNGILGMTQVMLADRTLAADARDRLNIVHGAGVTMRALVDDILDVAKMETGKLTIERIAFDLCDVVREATRMWDEQARAKGLGFTVALDACPSRVLGDPARLRQIVFNLLSNAIKFTRAGTIDVQLSHDGQRARISVSDSGIGIEAAQVDAIFESFRQADAGTTRQFGGTGLGLAICRNLARAMGGDVTVRSMPGEGSTFSIDLPLAFASDPVRAVSTSSTDRAAVAIVDRNPISRAMYRTLLKPCVDDVRLAASLDDLPDGRLALLLVDESVLRGVDDAAARLAERGDGAPILLLWNGDVPNDLRAIPGVEVVNKPIPGSGLVARIEAMLCTPELVREAA